MNRKSQTNSTGANESPAQCGIGPIEQSGEAILRRTLQWYSRSQASSIFKQLDILMTCIAMLRRDLDAPHLTVADLRPAYPVLLAASLSASSKAELIFRLYCAIYSNPQWTRRGHIGWVARQIEDAVAAERDAHQDRRPKQAVCAPQKDAPEVLVSLRISSVACAPRQVWEWAEPNLRMIGETNAKCVDVPAAV